MKTETILTIVLVALGIFTGWYLYNAILVKLIGLPPLNAIQVWAVDVAVTYFLVNHSDHEVTQERLILAIRRTINALIIGWCLTFFI